MADEDGEVQKNDALDVLQSMIDISADRLEGLRTQCATSAELTQQEIRTLEVNILFGKLLRLRIIRRIIGNCEASQSARTQSGKFDRLWLWSVSSKKIVVFTAAQSTKLPK